MQTNPIRIRVNGVVSPEDFPDLASGLPQPTTTPGSLGKRAQPCWKSVVLRYKDEQQQSQTVPVPDIVEELPPPPPPVVLEVPIIDASLARTQSAPELRIDFVDSHPWFPRPVEGDKSPLFLKGVNFGSPRLPRYVSKFRQEVSALSVEVFNEDCVEIALTDRKARWVICLLVSVDYEHLYGFSSHRIRTSLKSLELGRLAVPKPYGGRGYGTMLMKEVMAIGRREYPRVKQVCLSSLDTSVSFYTRLGFKKRQDLFLPQSSTPHGASDSATPPGAAEGSLLTSFETFDEFTVIRTPSTHKINGPPSSSRGGGSTIKAVVGSGDGSSYNDNCTDQAETSSSHQQGGGVTPAAAASQPESELVRTSSTESEWQYVEGQVFMVYKYPKQGKVERSHHHQRYGGIW